MTSRPTQALRVWPTPDYGFLLLLDPYTDQTGNPVTALANGTSGDLLIAAPNGVALLTRAHGPVDMRIEVFDHDPGPERGWDRMEVADFRFRGPDVHLHSGTFGPCAAVILSPPGACVVRAHRTRTASGDAWLLQVWARAAEADESLVRALAHPPRPVSAQEAHQRLALFGHTPFAPHEKASPEPAEMTHAPESPDACW